MLDIQRRQTAAAAFAGLFIVLFSAPCNAQPSISVESEVKESVIAGSPDRFMEVRHVVIRGTNFEIGRAIGQIARENGVTVQPSTETAPKKRLWTSVHAWPFLPLDPIPRITLPTVLSGTHSMTRRSGAWR